MSATFIIAQHKVSGVLVHVQDVPRGLACQCICCECGGQLEAVKGRKKSWHFRHHVKSNCKGGRESALHLYVKTLLCESQFISLRNERVDYTNPRMEQTTGKYRSDVQAMHKGNVLHFEIVVCHAVDSAKEHYYKSNRINSILIDLSDPKWLSANLDEIKAVVIGNAPKYKRFLYWNKDSVAVSQEENLLESSEQNEKDQSDTAMFILLLIALLALLGIGDRKPKYRGPSRKGSFL